MGLIARPLPTQVGAPHAYAWRSALGERRTWLVGFISAILLTLPAWVQWLDPHLNLLWEDAKGVDDAKNHMLRLFLLGWMVRHGVWYPRWIPDLFMGYGYPLFNYYAPGFYYLAMALRAALRLDVWDAYRAAGACAALLGAAGAYSVTATVWRRPMAGVLAAVALLYGPYVIQTNLFQRGDIPEALALALTPWLLLCIWQLWHSRTAGGQRWWLILTALNGAALLLTHNLTAIAAALVATAWTAWLLIAERSWGSLTRVVTAGALAAGLAAFFWLPAFAERSAVQLEILEEGHLDYHQWLLDWGGHSPLQTRPENRQTPGGPIDLHLFYPHQHQFIVTLKPGLGQAVLAALALGGAAAARWGHLRGGPVLPLWSIAMTCWALLFSFSAPAWAAIPGLALLQVPVRLMGPLGVCIAIAGGGGTAQVAAWLEAHRHGRALAVGTVVLLTAAVWLNGAGDREVPYYVTPRKPMDGAMVVQEEGDKFGAQGTTSGGEFTPRSVQIATYTAGQRRGRQVFEKLFPEADWLGGLFYPLAGDLRFLGWTAAPLAASVRVVNDGAQTAQVALRQFDFPGWRGWVDGRPVPLRDAPYVPEQQAALGFLVVDVPPGEHTVSFAFGPTPLRGAATAASAAAATVLIWLAAGLPLRALTIRARGPALPRPGLRMTASILATTAVAYLAWRGLRPAFGRFATPPAPSAQITDSTWHAGPNSSRANGPGTMLVNVAEAVRTGQARISSPSGSEIGADRFVDVRQLTVPDPDPDRGLAGTSRREELYLHPPSSAAVDLVVPTGREVWFQAALTLDPQTWTAPTGDGVRFQVEAAQITAGGVGAATVVSDRLLNPRANPAERRWVPVEADLSPWGGQRVQLTLRTLPNADATFDWAGWGNPLVVVRNTARVRAPVH